MLLVLTGMKWPDLKKHIQNNKTKFNDYVSDILKFLAEMNASAAVASVVLHLTFPNEANLALGFIPYLIMNTLLLWFVSYKIKP